MKRNSFAIILASIIAASMLLGSCGDSSENSASGDNNSKEDSVSANSSVSISDDSDSSLNESTGTNNDNSSDESIENNDISDTSDVSDTESSSEEVSDTESDTETSVDDGVDGSGTKDDPYLAIPDEDMHVVTVKIPAGKDVYYNIYRVGGMNLKINSSDVYVIYDEKTYNPKNAVLSLKVADAMASEAITFRIGNNSSSEKSFELVFTNPIGTYMNPTVIKNIGTKNVANLAEGNSVGHYYKYVAEKNGTIKFSMTSTEDSMMSVTNNRNSAQRTTEADGTEENGTYYIELEVQKGDEIIINVGAVPNRRGKYPATDITWSGEYK